MSEADRSLIRNYIETSMLFFTILDPRPCSPPFELRCLCCSPQSLHCTHQMLLLSLSRQPSLPGCFNWPYEWAVRSLAYILIRKDHLTVFHFRNACFRKFIAWVLQKAASVWLFYSRSSYVFYKLQQRLDISPTFHHDVWHKGKHWDISRFYIMNEPFTFVGLIIRITSTLLCCIQRWALQLFTSLMC